MKKRYVAYLRVSTSKQGVDGLGMEAQREAIRAYNDAVKEEFIEVESGKHNDRPELKKALEHCKRTRSVLLVAKLDRLARNVAFISALMDSGVEFVACDFPDANRLTLHILAAVAEHEAKMVSVRTKAALAQAKARGVKLGNPNLTHDARIKGNQVKSEKANKFAAGLKTTIDALKGKGMTLRGIARELNRLEVKTARGKEWTPTAVKNLLERPTNESMSGMDKIKKKQNGDLHDL